MVLINRYITSSLFVSAVVFLFAGAMFIGSKPDKPKAEKNNILDITVKDAEGKKVPLSKYKGKVLMIVNVASKCGNTPQYSQLEKIYEKYKPQGFEILAFPCNDFGGQEPGSNEEINEFCSVNYGVKFKLFDKIKVLGADRSPLYERLINNDVTRQGDVKWNFEKFLISKDGNIVARFENKTQPSSKEVITAIEKELSKDLAVGKAQ